MAKQRICVIGNSHVAAWRVGLDRVPALADDFEFDFFAAQSNMMSQIELQGTRLVPTAVVTRNRIAMVSGGKTEIETAGYDRFIILGLGFNIVKPVEAMQGHRLYEFPQSGEEGAAYLSAPCHAAMVASFLRHSTAMHFVRLLRAVTGRDIVLVPQPYPSESIVRSPHWRTMVESGVLAHTVRLHEECASALSNEAGCRLLLQPIHTVAGVGLTKACYSTDSVRLAVDMTTKHPDTEPFHMNAVYGEEMLKSYRSLLPG